MAGSRADVRLTQSNDDGEVMSAIANIQINGMSHFFAAIKIA